MAARESRPKASRAFQLHGEIQALVEHARERMRRIQADRREHRHHLIEEIIADPGALRFVEVVAAQKAHPGFFQLGQDLFVEQPVLALHHLMRDAADRDEHVARIHAVGPGAGQIDADRLLQLGDANLEKFVQVAADDAKKAQAFEQGRVRILGLGQHAAVEFQDADFPVEKQGLRLGHGVFFLEYHSVSFEYCRNVTRFGETATLLSCWLASILVPKRPSDRSKSQSMQHNHISTQFDAQLEQVRSKVLHMGGAVEDQLSLAVQALHSGEMFADRAGARGGTSGERAGDGDSTSCAPTSSRAGRRPRSICAC